MKGFRDRIVDRFLDKSATRRWARTVQNSSQMPVDLLRDKRNQARELRKHLDDVLHVAEGRLGLPIMASDVIQAPKESDWSWRPELWRGPISPTGRAAVPKKSRIGRETGLFHDCDISEITFRQVRNQRAEDLAPYCVRFDVFKFDGSFLSVVLDLPADAVAGISKRHLMRFDCALEVEKPLELFVRFNIKHGPNTEQLVREVTTKDPEFFVEFDLAYTEMNEKRVERMWVELIFENPELNQISLRDVTFSRYARAEL